MVTKGTKSFAIKKNKWHCEYREQFFFSREITLVHKLSDGKQSACCISLPYKAAKWKNYSSLLEEENILLVHKRIDFCDCNKHCVWIKNLDCVSSFRVILIQSKIIKKKKRSLCWLLNLEQNFPKKWHKMKIKCCIKIRCYNNSCMLFWSNTFASGMEHIVFSASGQNLNTPRN